MSQSSGSVFWGGFWMFLISILLFWLPGIGSLIAGVVGGKVAGSVGNALLAAFGGFILGLVHAGMLMLGAIIGGVIA